VHGGGQEGCASSRSLCPAASQLYRQPRTGGAALRCLHRMLAGAASVWLICPHSPAEPALRCPQRRLNLKSLPGSSQCCCCCCCSIDQSACFVLMTQGSHCPAGTACTCLSALPSIVVHGGGCLLAAPPQALLQGLLLILSPSACDCICCGLCCMSRHC
jgi:hypothetical protein